MDATDRPPMEIDLSDFQDNLRLDHDLVRREALTAAQALAPAADRS